MQRPDLLAAALLALLVAASPAAGQDAAAPAPPPGPVAEPQLKFEREIFPYPGSGRRDPFTPLSIESEGGPRFEDLVLRGIIFSPGPPGSVALVADGSGRIHRVRRGESLGNARVLEISPLRVLFAVETFGMVKQEMLELRKKPVEGAKE